MAVNTDKALYSGLGGLPVGEEGNQEFQKPALEIEIEIEPAEEDGLLEDAVEEAGFDANLAEYMDGSELHRIASELLEDFDSDLQSRREWEQTYRDGIELLGLKVEERTEPWPGACGVFHPILTEAAVRFQSEAITETFPAAGPVKTQIIGKATKEKQDAAARVRDDMNYQLTQRMVEYRPEHERMLFNLSIAGSAFKKIYFDPALDRQVSIFVPAEDIVVPYGASNLETAERVTHVMRKTKNEMRRLQVSGFYRDIELGEPTNTLDEVEKKKAEEQGMRALTDNRFKVLEMMVDYNLPGFEHPDDLPLPYVITIEKSTGEVLSIRRNWDEDDVIQRKRQHFVHYGYIPGFGFYSLGLIHLVGGFAKAGTSLIRQLVDAGTLSNLPGGYKSRGLRIKGDDTPISPGEFRDVDIPSGAIKDNIMPLPYKEPSNTLFQLLGAIIEEGRKLASSSDLKISDMSAQAPVGTTLALLERTLKIMSAIQARLHYSMRQEFRLLKDIIRDHAPEAYDYEPEEGDPTAMAADYDMVDVIPVSDPNAATMSQKVVTYQAALDLAQTAPQLYDLPSLHRQMLEVLGIKNASKLVPTAEDQTPKDPVSENMAMLVGKPVKAFIQQDHQAHIQTHMTASQDPTLQQMLANNPQAPAIQGAFMAHLNEHLGFLYRSQIEQQLGVALPPPDEPLPPEIEVQLSRLIAQAAQQLLQVNQAQAAQQQAQEQAQDPVVQMQQQELQLKAQEQMRKQAKDLVDAQLRAKQLQLEEKRIDTQAQIDGAKIGVDISKSHDNLKKEGTRMGIEIARDQAQRAMPQPVQPVQKGRAK